MIGNKVKDVESFYKQFEDLYNEIIEKLICFENENFSFFEFFKLLVDFYEVLKKVNDELFSKNKDYNEKIIEFE